MAATPSRPSNNQNTINSKNYKIEQPELNDTSVDNSDSSNYSDSNNKIENLKKSSCSNCKCTNISIMQLFHEMKQEFPKIPDHVVSQYVLDNCHNRNACIDKLRNETISLIQAYPSQIFKRDNGLKVANNNHNNNSNNTSENNISKNSNCVNNISDKNENYSDMSQSPFNKPISQDSNNNVNNNNNNNNINHHNNSHNNGGNNLHYVQRPNTLNFVKEPLNSVSAFSKPVIKPRRTAPPPPSLTSSSSTSNSPQSLPPPLYQQQQQQNHYQPPISVDQLSNAQLVSTPSPPQPVSDAIVSLNVKVSPVTGRPPIRPRHTTELRIQQQPPFLRDIHPNSRSHTSVYFNLRPPSDNPQSPINITAGPSLTYSSSSFDARQGHQNQLQITIGDGSGLITAMRAQPRQLQVTRSVDDDRGRLDGYNYNQEPIENHLLDEIIHKQLMQKERLSMELKNNKKHLDTLQREIRALQSPLPLGGSIRLADEITRLQSVCQSMTQEVEEAGVYVIGETDEAFYNNIYTGQKLSIQDRPSRPPRPPPPAVRSVSQPAASGGGASYNLSSLGYNSNNNNSALNSLNNSNLINNNNLLPHSHNSNINDNNNNNHNLNNNNSNSEEPWICSVCTFQNHPLLDTCEQCEMIKFNTVDSSSNNGGTGMIQITGTHFSPRIQDMRLLKSSSPCTPPSVLLIPSQTNGSFAPTNLTANTTTSPNHFANGFMLPN